MVGAVPRRRALGMFLLIGGLLCLLMSWGGWQYLFADYRDSSLLAYVSFGLFWTVIGLGLLLTAVRILRSRGRPAK